MFVWFSGNSILFSSKFNFLKICFTDIYDWVVGNLVMTIIPIRHECGMSATDSVGKPESTERQINTLWAMVFSWNLLTMRKIYK